MSVCLLSDRANHSDASIEICRHCPPEYEVESLPSYTIVSGLPTYDDALEEFRKAGIILRPALVPVIKIFENANNEAGGVKEPSVAYSLVETSSSSASDANADTISLTSITCNCGGSSPTGTLPSYSAATAAAMTATAAAGNPLNSQVIELSPDHLASLSQKRLSLQISFNNSLRCRSRSNMRNHLLRSRAVGNSAVLGPIETTLAAASVVTAPAATGHILPHIHRSSSTVSLSNERQLLDQRLRHLHHRGSLY
ncbi:GH10048 [Drosophila grimshawi]|uniref:GH10048 n=1 Tax=Drosophila grimshawi TaxID=7222 RepID=B4K1C0_DROGR|nr:GH10048 [Drosophila grimshawi]